MILKSDINPFENYSGSSGLAKPKTLMILLFSLLLVGLLLAKMGVMGAGVVIGLIFAAIFMYLIFSYPIIGFYTAIAFNFTMIGLGRYIPGLPVGFTIDGILLLTYLALIMNRFRTRVDWTPAKKDITVLATIWFGYSVFQIINPEAQSFAAWVSGRGIAFYMFLLVPLVLIFINTSRKLSWFFFIWGVLSILGTIKGIMQLNLGVDFAEQAWLNAGNHKTHILFGKLRVFSFYSDAGQFGANQAYSAVVAFVYSMSQKKKAHKFFFIFVALMGMYGLVISGTRGAISVPMAGLMTFFVLRKNVKVLSVGVVLLLIVFIFFKFTMIGQGNAQIRRMRSAFDPNDASLQVRLANQRLLKNYLSSRPFGGGIGHGGTKAQKFLPYAFLSQVATDSWYVLIWVEQGIVGLTLHLCILFYVMGKASYMVMFRIRDPILKLKMSALISGMAGVMVASYGNAVLGTMPTALLIYTTMAVVLNSEVFDIPIEEDKNETIKINS